jgi:hypothetical protein
MADVLVKALNALGYQPVFLPRTGIAPPELYTFVKPRLVRHGDLRLYLNNAPVPKPTRGQLADIQTTQTSGKNFGAATDFLKSALTALGITSIPKVDLSFAGTGTFVFSFSNLTYASVDPAQIEILLPNLKIPPAISDDVVNLGQLHIAYEYAYSDTLRMSREDGSTFANDISGKVGDFIDVSTNTKVEVQGNRVVSFVSTGGEKAAFAYKAGQVLKMGDTWIFRPETVKRDVDAEPTAFVPAKGVVLLAEDSGT